MASLDMWGAMGALRPQAADRAATQLHALLHPEEPGQQVRLQDAETELINLLVRCCDVGWGNNRVDSWLHNTRHAFGGDIPPALRTTLAEVQGRYHQQEEW